MATKKLTPQQRLAVAYHKSECTDPNCDFKNMDWKAPHNKTYLDKSVELLHKVSYKEAMNQVMTIKA